MRRLKKTVFEEMIRCIIAECTWKSSTYDRLFDHLKNYHGELTRYACNIEKCTRTYGIRSSFIRHFKSHFINSDNSGSSGPTDRSIISIADADDRIPSGMPQCNFPSFEAVSNANINSNTTKPDDIQNNITEKMSKLNLELNLKWLNINSMPRKTVFELQKDLQDKIFTPFHQIFNTLETTGLLTHEGKKVLDNMIDSFSKNETEYKFKQRLEALDLYVDAREFVISNQLHCAVVNNEPKMENDPITGAFEELQIILLHFLMHFFFQEF